jgi:hypothetical protein
MFMTVSFSGTTDDGDKDSRILALTQAPLYSHEPDSEYYIGTIRSAPSDTGTDSNNSRRTHHHRL